jgi:hypothetical protein
MNKQKVAPPPFLFHCHRIKQKMAMRIIEFTKAQHIRTDSREASNSIRHSITAQGYLCSATFHK